MRGRTEMNNMPNSTVLPYQPNSCKNCWNKPKGPADDELAPRTHGIYVSLPVYLVDPYGNVLELGYRAQCPDCRDVKIFDGGFCLYRLNGRRADFNAKNWPLVRRFGLDVHGLNAEALKHPETRYFEAEKLPKYQSGRHQADFYEPKRRENYAAI